MTIRHIDVAGDLAAEPPVVGDEFLVLWYGDWPVGQLRGRDTAGPAARLRDRVPDDVLARAAAGAALERAGRPPDGRKVSVVICTRDRAEDLARCLAALPGQTRVPDQVVVVDNASRDDGRTRAVALAAGVDYVREDRPGLDIARNRGVRTAIGDIIAFTDDDVRLHPRWLERMAAAFDRDHVLAVTGLVLPAELETAAQLHFETYRGLAAATGRSTSARSSFARTAPVAARPGRSAQGPAWPSGGRRSGAPGCSTSGSTWARPGARATSRYRHRVLFHGGTCRYEPAAAAFHYHRRDFAGLSRQITAYMRGHAAALLVQYERSGNLGSLRRAMATVPAWYARRWLRTLRGRAERDVLLAEETRGFVSGLLFYLRTPRPYHATLDQEP